MSRYRRRSLGDAFGYLPGEQPADADGWLKLNTNESPLPPSPRVAEAVAGAAAALSRYPSPHAEPLRSLLAERHGVAAEQVFVANGADQVLDCCYRAYAEPGDAVVHATPTYSLFPVLAQVFSVRDVAVPLRPDGALRTGFAAEDAPLRFVVNPNSPTGQWVAPQELEGQLEGAAGVVVIDEAYADFAPASALSRLRHHANWVVVRTLSKSYALAGLRVGYAVAARDLISDLDSVKDSYPVDRCAIAGAVAAIEDEGHHARIVETVRRERARLHDALTELGGDVLPSQANFVFAQPPPPQSAVEVAARLREARILVRHFDAPGIDARLRITVGDSAATDRLLEAVGDQATG